MLEHMEKTATQPVADQTVFISHGDCEDDMNYLADEIRKRFGCTDIRTNFIDPVIGAHAGPGTLALFFMADKR
jgi:fatty acid-binding protein DegV